MSADRPPRLRLALTTRAGLSGPPLSAADLRPGELARLASYRTNEARERFLAGRQLLRQLVPDFPDIDPDGRTVRTSGHANLSHSGGWLLAAAADEPIGVDLEVIRPRRGDLLALARHVHGDAQCAEIAALLAARRHGEALCAFYRWWTLKEAWLKCRGRGLDWGAMRQLDFHLVSAPMDDVARFADCACARLDRAGVMVSVVVDPSRRGAGITPQDLPAEMAGEPARWQLLESRPSD